MDEAANPETEKQKVDNRRWRRRPIAAGLVQVLVLIAPGLAAFATTGTLVHQLSRPSSGAGLLAWWVIMLAGTIAIMVTVNQVVRPLLPLTRLLRLELTFPHRAPSRWSTTFAAMSRSRRGKLLRQLRAGGLDPTVATTALVALVARLTVHDRLNAGHSERVLSYSRQIGRQLGLEPDELHQLSWAALVHDIGKLMVPAELLASAARPSEREFQRLRDHTSEGDHLVRALRPFLGTAVHVPAEHHEWFDGSGYPLGLRGDEISIFGRIVSVADVFDVLTAVDSYRPKRSLQEAFAELKREAGLQLDPIVVQAAVDAGLHPARHRHPGGFLTDLTQTGVRSISLARSGALAVVSGVTVLVAAQSLPAPAELVQVTVDRADAVMPELGGAINLARSKGGDDQPELLVLDGGADQAGEAEASTGPPTATQIGVTKTDAGAATGGAATGGSATSSPAPAPTGSTPTSSTTASTSSTPSSTSSSSPTSSTTSTAAPTTTTVAPATGPMTWWLLNPGTGDTASSVELPLGSSAPTDADPANYDTNRDTGPGLRIRKGPDGLDTTDSNRVQVWTVTQPTGRSVDGSVQLFLWAATRNFNPAKSATLAAALERCTGGVCTRMATDEVTFAGASNWVALSFDFGPIAQTWAPDDEVVVRVASPGTSGDHPWIAYDSVATPARLVVGP